MNTCLYYLLCIASLIHTLFINFNQFFPSSYHRQPWPFNWVADSNRIHSAPFLKRLPVFPSTISPLLRCPRISLIFMFFFFSDWIGFPVVPNSKLSGNLLRLPLPPQLRGRHHRRPVLQSEIHGPHSSRNFHRLESTPVRWILLHLLCNEQASFCVFVYYLLVSVYHIDHINNNSVVILGARFLM